MTNWVMRALSPYRLNNGKIARVGAKLYVTGGSAVGITAADVLYIYDIATDTWSSGPPMPGPKTSHGCAVVGTKIYCLGGVDADWNPSPTYIFDTLTNTWSAAGQFPWGGKLDFGCAAVGNRIFCVGGFVPGGGPDDVEKEIIVYHAETGGWAKWDTPLPGGKNWTTCVTVGETVYCLGGMGDQRTFAIDTKNEKVSVVATPNRNFYDFGADVHGSNIYCVGWDFGSTEIYNYVDNYWWHGPPTPTGIRTRRCAVYEGVLYATHDNGSGNLGVMSLDLRTATIVNPQPTAGFVNERQPVILSWGLESTPATATQKTAQVQWRETGSSTVHTIDITGAQTSVTIPPGVLPNGSIQWRVRAVNTLDIATAWTDWYTLTTIDEPPLKPTGLYPDSGVRPGTSPIQFSWLHRSPLSTPQRAYELQVTYNDGATWVDLSGVVALPQTSFTAAAGSLSPLAGGRVGWRVRTYNSDFVASPWSDTAYIIVRTAPQTPTWRNVEAGKSRPLCEWVAPDQIAYQLQVYDGSTGVSSLVYDTGTVYGTDTSHRIKTVYLHNRPYHFRVRVQNGTIGQNGLAVWSDWAGRDVTVSARKRLSVTLTGEAIENGASLSWDTEVTN